MHTTKYDMVHFIASDIENRILINTNIFRHQLSVRQATQWNCQMAAKINSGIVTSVADTALLEKGFKPGIALKTKGRGVVATLTSALIVLGNIRYITSSNLPIL